MGTLEVAKAVFIRGGFQKPSLNDAFFLPWNCGQECVLYNSNYSRAGNFREFRDNHEICEIFLHANIKFLQNFPVVN